MQILQQEVVELKEKLAAAESSVQVEKRISVLRPSLGGKCPSCEEMRLQVGKRSPYSHQNLEFPLLCGVAFLHQMRSLH